MGLQKVFLVTIALFVGNFLWSQDCLLNNDLSVYELVNRDHNYDAIVKTKDNKSLLLFGYKTFYTTLDRSVFDSYSKPAFGIHNLSDCEFTSYVPFKSVGHYRYSHFADNGQMALYSWNTMSVVNISKLKTYQNYALKKGKMSLVGAGLFKSDFYALTTTGKGETVLNMVKQEDGSLIKTNTFSNDHSLYYGYLTSDGLMYCFFNDNYEKILLRTYQVDFDGANINIREIAYKSYDDDLFDISMSQLHQLNFDKNQELYVHFMDEGDDHQFRQVVFKKDGSYRKGPANKTIQKYKSKYQVLYSDDNGNSYICLKEGLDEVKVLKINVLNGSSSVRTYEINGRSKVTEGEKDATITRCIGIVKVGSQYLIAMGVTNITAKKEYVLYKKLSHL